MNGFFLQGSLPVESVYSDFSFVLLSLYCTAACILEHGGWRQEGNRSGRGGGIDFCSRGWGRILSSKRGKGGEGDRA